MPNYQKFKLQGPEKSLLRSIFSAQRHLWDPDSQTMRLTEAGFDLLESLLTWCPVCDYIHLYGFQTLPKVLYWNVGIELSLF